MNSLQSKWEYQLQKARSHSHKLFMNEDWVKGGHFHAADIKPPPKPEISMLEVHEPSTVVRLRHSKAGPFWVKCLAMPPPQVCAVVCNGKRHRVLEVQDMRIRITEPLPGPSAQVSVICLIPTSDVQDITHMTIKFWEQYWMCDDEPDLEAIHEAMSNIPPVPSFHATIQVHEVQDAIKQSKPQRARGPDLFSNEDLKRLPPELISQLRQVCNLCQTQTQWPQSLLDATVALLPKEEHISGLEDTRPVAVLSAVYRIWSRIITRKFLKNTHEHLPSSIHGNRERSSSVWLASYIQIALEHALHVNLECNVASVDLKKAFNLISRKILCTTGTHFGTPIEVVSLHQAFLDSLVRSFRVGRQITPGMKSSRGVPEGCGFSCAMMQLNWIVSAHLNNRAQVDEQAQFYNYVDNWLFMSSMRQAVVNSLHEVYDFAPLASYRVSAGKTWASGTSNAARQYFHGLSIQDNSVLDPLHWVVVAFHPSTLYVTSGWTLGRWPRPD